MDMRDLGSLRKRRGTLVHLAAYRSEALRLGDRWEDAETADLSELDAEMDVQRMVQELLRLRRDLDPTMSPVERTLVYRGRSGNVTAVALVMRSGVTVFASKAVLRLLDDLKVPVPETVATSAVPNMQSNRQRMPVAVPKRTYEDRLLTEEELSVLTEVRFQDSEGRWIPAFAIPTKTGLVPVCFHREPGTKLYSTKRERVRFERVPSVPMVRPSRGPSPSSGSDDPTLN
jgi:hypothetical protein